MNYFGGKVVLFSQSRQIARRDKMDRRVIILHNWNFGEKEIYGT